jgi:hypothetical protein
MAHLTQTTATSGFRKTADIFKAGAKTLPHSFAKATARQARV